MLEAKIGHATILRRLFDVIKDMVAEVNLDCSEEGIRLQAMDTSHVSLVSLTLEDSGFLHYRCDRERALGLNMPSVCKVFKLCGSNDSVAIHNEDDNDSVTFVFENAAEDKISNFALKLMSIDQDALGIPENDEAWDVVMKLPSKEFSNTCRTMQEFSDTLRIEVDKNGIKFCTAGDVGRGAVVLKPREANGDDDVGVELKVRNPVNQSYAVKHLNQFAKAGSLCDSVTISLSSDKPIEVRFEITDKLDDADAKTRMGEIKFFLAPKMDDDDATME
ncbi:proliferating cell nuclear antigen PCna1 [Cardiosporidium cionae]|uniref:DNA sliding clamp PCNA n=1 Tax=Cardiosporidium cionae TaxID=476202 RepID=A0ABQ7JBY8_9APIC|nr:proliferating cell nuclear antigen PCna1 [Cardiosporidium cionae]|eukprot:KAF8821463.1 proliferating cell nuclear antigen PCna1 [Cardiosporidium cionae]